jgi:hypothetical protein
MLSPMLGLDDWIASLAHGEGLVVVAVVAVALGLRHATDPDHLAAVGALVAGDDRGRGRAARLGLAWGAGHATSLFALGLPVVLYRAYLPESLQRAAEVAVGVVICLLAASLLLRRGHGHRPARTPLRALGIGLLHGAAGSAGVGILLLAAIGSGWLGVGGLALFAACTALSMAALSTGLGTVLAARRAQALMPAFAAATLVFGAWYAVAAASL